MIVWINVVILIILLITLVMMSRQNRQLKDSFRKLREVNMELSFTSQTQMGRAERFKKQCLKLTDENIELTRKLSRATIHQPPPTIGE